MQADHDGMPLPAVLFAVVEGHSAQYRFKHRWPPGFPPFDETLRAIPPSILKYRMVRYWIDVVAFYLTSASPAHSTLLSAAFLRVLQPLTLLVVNDSSTEELERAAYKSMAGELARGELARVQIGKLAAGRLLGLGLPLLRKREKVEIVALGGNELVYTALRDLVHTVTTLAGHPYSALHPNAGPMLKADEERWRAIPRHVHITLGETGPALEGLTLARSLRENLMVSTHQSNVMREMARVQHKRIAPAIEDDYEPSSLADKLISVLQLDPEVDEPPPGLDTVGTLRALVDEAERLSRPECKIVIELIPDGALANAVRMAGSDVAVVLGADRILPSKADTICRMGSYTLAQCAKAKKSPVYALASTAYFESGLSNKAWEPTLADPFEMLSTWSATPQATKNDEAAASVANFAAAALDEEDSTIKVTVQTDELVPGDLIDCWITEAGLLSAEGCSLLCRERYRAELDLFGQPR